MWFFVTWHENVTRLSRLCSVIYRGTNTHVISIGGMSEPENISALSALLSLGNTHFLYRRPVAWGGQKLLFHNLLEAARAFDARADKNAWLQVICNRTFPLVGPKEMAERLAVNIFAREPSRFHKIAPPGWREEWPDEIVRDLPRLYSEALDEIFETANPEKFLRLATYEAIYKSSYDRVTPQSFNFSERAEVMSTTGTDSVHRYAISPFGVDARWMSFARLGEFVDTSAENGFTYARRADTVQVQWAHKIISQYNFRIGSPFITASKRYVHTLLHDERCTELMAVMNHGFGPEMNVFDTIGMSHQFKLMYEYGHLYFRTPTHTATDADIEVATEACEKEGVFFLRKTLAAGSAEFIRHFTAKISKEWDHSVRYYSTSVPSPIAGASIPTLDQVVALIPDGARMDLRSLMGQALGAFRVFRDGRVMDLTGASFGGWRIEDKDFVLVFPWGEKIYRRGSSMPGKLLLPPSEVVSAANNWGIFVEIELGDEPASAESRCVDFALPSDLLSADRTWITADSEHAVMLAALEPNDDPDYPPAVQSARARGTSLGSLDLGSVTFADRKCAVVMRDAAPGAQAATVNDLPITLTARDLIGVFQIQTLDVDAPVHFHESGRLLDESGEHVGDWRVRAGAVWILGLPRIRLACGRQFTRTNAGWRISGWGWKDFKNPVSFSATQVG
ncbi:hypothetical protein CIW48_08960 [Methylobacterium sp. P1-11]|nr:hypothetical protein CIW48_08960 [Methylobacterium sp. P1-11]